MNFIKSFKVLKSANALTLLRKCNAKDIQHITKSVLTIFVFKMDVRITVQKLKCATEPKSVLERNTYLYLKLGPLPISCS
jgi:hypothetical protein